jgi:hypothetical protein
MAEHDAIGRHRAFRGLTAAILALVLAAFLLPAQALAVPGAGQSCPDTTAAPDSTAAVCGESKGPEGDPGAGGGSLDIGGLLPVLAAAAGGAVIALAAAFLILRRRTGGPVAPADPGEWWTCRNCGSNNVIGSPRCYSCGQWQR